LESPRVQARMAR